MALSSLQTARDIPLLVTCPSASISGERRISPSWSLSTLKSKLEPITGIPPSFQDLLLKVPGQADVVLAAEDESAFQVGRWNLVRGAEIEVRDGRPPGQQQGSGSGFGGMGGIGGEAEGQVERYVMPEERYEGLSDSVLAWKRKAKLGRFDPGLPGAEAERVARMKGLVGEKAIEVGRRCQLDGDEGEGVRRGAVRYVGEIEELPGVKGGLWVGVELDEPVGRNDGFVGRDVARRRVFECRAKHGVFVRPERVAIGDFPVLDDMLDDEDMEEI